MDPIPRPPAACVKWPHSLSELHSSETLGKLAYPYDSTAIEETHGDRGSAGAATALAPVSTPAVLLIPTLRFDSVATPSEHACCSARSPLLRVTWPPTLDCPKSMADGRGTQRRAEARSEGLGQEA